MTPAALQAHLMALEQRLLEPAVRADAAALDALLAEDFGEVGRSGRRYDRDAILALLLAEDASGAPAGVRLDHVELRAWPGVALLTYRSTHLSAQGESTRLTWRASLWRDDGPRGWRMSWHQGTPCAAPANAPAGGPAS